MRISPGDEANSDDQSKHTHDGRRDAVQLPCQRNAPRPCDQNEGSDDAGCHGMSDRERDASSRGVAQHVLVILRVDRCQNDPGAQRNGDATCAIDFALPLTCWRARGETLQGKRGTGSIS
jgi:hypothetical protein